MTAERSERSAIATLGAAILCLCIGCGGIRDEYFPLSPGWAWEYEVERIPAGSPGQLQRIAVRNLGFREIEGRRVTPQRIEVGGGGELEFVVQDIGGVGIYARQSPLDLEPVVLPAPDYWVRLPLVRGASWSGASANVFRRGHDVAFFDTRTTIESLNAEVTVSAGTFTNCLKLRMDGEGTLRTPNGTPDAKLNVEEHRWYCSGVGLVRMVRTERSEPSGIASSGIRSMELVSWSKP
jgi:hypothetical protein